MGPQISDDFLIRLVEDISSIKATVSNLGNQLEKLDERVVDPFQEWLLAVRLHSKNIVDLEHKMVVVEGRLATLQASYDGQKSSHDAKILELTTRMDKAKWYATGAVACGTVAFGILYKLFEILLSFLKK